VSNWATSEQDVARTVDAILRIHQASRMHREAMR